MKNVAKVVGVLTVVWLRQNDHWSMLPIAMHPSMGIDIERSIVMGSSLQGQLARVWGVVFIFVRCDHPRAWTIILQEFAVTFSLFGSFKYHSEAYCKPTLVFPLYCQSVLSVLEVALLFYCNIVIVRVFFKLNYMT